ncbi:MAG: hypothetical protein N2379_09245 [Verrucomicrobiae bacterium]|nr:hypothetical protein [Verrucomicrobiae bacterium]
MKQFEQGQGTSSSVSLPTNGTPPLPVVGARAPALPGSGVDQTVAQQTSSSQAVLNYLNFSFSALMSAGVSTARNGEIRTGHPAPYERGFSLNSAELAVEGAVDPYFKAAGSVSLVLDPDGHSEVELEEAWAATTALPFGLQVKAGLFQAAFGRHNQQHAHEWAFVDQPIVLTRLLGDDGLRQPGAQLSWLVPIAVYSELSLGVFNNRNPGFVATDETAEGWHSVLHGGALQDHELRGPGDLLFVPRMSVSFDLTGTQTLLGGVSAAFGPNNSGPGADTQVYGLDIYWKWRPERAEAGFPFVAVQAEALYRRYEAAARVGPTGAVLPAETLRDWGLYGQVLWGFKRRWVAAFRAEFASADTGAFDSDLRNDRFRLSPNLTFYPTEYSKLRFQYNFDHRQIAGADHSAWVQLEFILGAHAAHKF